MVQVLTRLDRLTEAQRMFAREQRANPLLGTDSEERMIFMYRSDDLGTSRWLVDHAGRVVDSAVFRRSDGAGDH